MLRPTIDVKSASVPLHEGRIATWYCEVMELVVAGRLNKQVAAVLGISEITVKAHRGRVMQKMQDHSLPDLVNMAAGLRSAPAASRIPTNIVA